jgi:hypothetical protein
MRDGDVVELGRVERNLWATKQQTLAGGSGCAASTTMKLEGENRSHGVAKQIRNAAVAELMIIGHNNTAQGAARAISDAVLKVTVCLFWNCCCACVVVARSTRNGVCADEPMEVRCYIR